METNSNATRPRLSDGLLDGEKKSAAFLLSGVLLAMVGITFTWMGWHHLQANLSFKWTQLLGPILISVGGTFILTSVCKSRFFFCCRQQQDEVFVIPVGEQTSGRRPVVVHGINPPDVFQSPTAILCIQPAFSFVTQGLYQETEQQPSSSVSGNNSGLPSYDAVDNSTFMSQTNQGTSRIQKTGTERRPLENSKSTCSLPPAYEDLYPACHKHNPT